MTTPLRDFFAYNLWANLDLFDTCASLDDAVLEGTLTGTYGSIRATWLHVAQGEEGYVYRFTRQFPEQSLRGMTAFPGFAVLREHVKQSGEGLMSIAEHLDPAQVLHIEYEGQTHHIPATVVLIQAIAHGVDHRSQIGTLLTQQGISAPEIDGWSYFDRAIEPTQLFSGE